MKTPLVIVLMTICLGMTAPAVAQGYQSPYWYSQEPRPLRVDPYSGVTYDATGQKFEEWWMGMGMQRLDALFSTLQSGPARQYYWDEQGVAPQYRQRRPQQDPCDPRLRRRGPCDVEEREAPPQRTLSVWMNRTEKNSDERCQFPMVLYGPEGIARNRSGEIIMIQPSERFVAPADFVPALVVGNAHCRVPDDIIRSTADGAGRIVSTLPSQCADMRRAER